nr:integrase, catalytic region, zinc finger, CCHC-type, peptidase aspartic, catalytic [Tanacetum cinerariifolium]
MRSQLSDYGLAFNKILIYHFIKEQFENGVIELYFINTEYQLADLFTKALGRDIIEFLTTKLGMRSFTPETLKKLMKIDNIYDSNPVFILKASIPPKRKLDLTTGIYFLRCHENMDLSIGELMHSKQPDLLFFYVFGALCYPTNDSENISKLQPKADIGIFIGYALTKKAFRIYNRRTRRIVETIHVDFDELTAMASEQSSSGPALNDMIPGTISSGLVQKSSSSTSYVPPSRND